MDTNNANTRQSVPGRGAAAAAPPPPPLYAASASLRTTQLPSQGRHQHCYCCCCCCFRCRPVGGLDRGHLRVRQQLLLLRACWLGLLGA
eukprot:1153931-Pelagomonas_calceolata.AAC.3